MQARRNNRMLVPTAALVLFVSALATGSTSAAAAPTPAESSQRGIDQKVEALLAQMTLPEKFGQLEMAGPDGANGTPGPQLLPNAKAGLVGSVLSLVGMANFKLAQDAAMASRLQIPLIFSLDVIHGYQTIFPVPPGEASSWDPAAITTDESVSAAEATADGIKWTFNPVVDIARDPRWGRIVEGAGEDPYLGSMVAAAKVRVSGQRLQQTGEDGLHGQTSRRVRGGGGRPGIQHRRHVGPTFVQRLPAAVHGRHRRRRGDRDERVQLPQRRPGQCRSVPAAVHPPHSRTVVASGRAGDRHRRSPGEPCRPRRRDRHVRVHRAGMTDIPCRFVSSGGDVLVLPGDVFVVLGAGLEAAVQDADEPVRQLAERRVVTDLPGSESVVIGGRPEYVRKGPSGVSGPVDALARHVFGQRSVGSSSSALAWSWAVGRV